jgi:hypothetical protein
VKVIYIAGAFNAPTPEEREANVEAAKAAGLPVAALGAMPFIPHANTGHYYGALPESFWKRGCLELVARCDALYVYNEQHVRTSDGTAAEVEAANRLRRPVFSDLATLAEWLAQTSGLDGPPRRFERWMHNPGGGYSFHTSDWLRFWNGLTDRERESLRRRAEAARVSLSHAAIEWGATAERDSDG